MYHYFHNILLFVKDKLSILDNFNHLKNKNISYAEHLTISSDIAFKLSVGSLKAMIHAIYPDVYCTSTTDLSKELTNTIINPKTE
jgi:hypothetical protein